MEHMKTLFNADTDDAMMAHSIDVACDDLHKNENFTYDALGLMSNPNNEHSQKLHERHQKQCTDYCHNDGARKLETAALLLVKGIR